MQLVPLTNMWQKDWFDLYQTAFPAAERRPFDEMLALHAAGATTLFCLIEDDAFAGLAAAAEEEGLLFVDFLAVEPALRGGGAGSRALDALKERAERIVLEIESPDVPCDNREQRMRRKAFYQKNGFTDSGLRAYVYDTAMEILSYGRVTWEEYLRMFDRTHPDTPAARRPRLLRQGRC